MSLQSVADVPLLVSSPNSSSERRISPSWTIAHLKSRLEPITGVPASSQQLSLRVASQDALPITAADEEQTRLTSFPLQPYAEIIVSASLYSVSHCLLACLPSPALSWTPMILPSSQQLPHMFRSTPALHSPAICWGLVSSARVKRLALCPHSLPQSCYEAVSPSMHG
jgi:hypothetical protein